MNTYVAVIHRIPRKQTRLISMEIVFRAHDIAEARNRVEDVMESLTITKQSKIVELYNVAGPHRGVTNG
jgi:hypothetical protein